MTRPRRSQLLLALVTAAAVAAALAVLSAQQPATDVEDRVDRIFSRWTASTPGCAVGVAVDGETRLARAYGMADLERDVRNTPGTIFEAGSVSKQFTAAAVLLLAREGRLSLDDPARRYVPELPDYGTPLTIRHMLTHTSGLRDWGSVAAIAGWSRTTRVHTHAHVLDIVSRQTALNFTPGTRWSYSNTGYNLAAIVVSRVSGMSFADFTRERIFQPLGMTNTSWRDDHTRIVKNRAIAYAEEAGSFHLLMPFENVHGNGGLLTTVGDLLKWNENFVAPRVGDAAFVAEQLHPGRFSDGRSHEYALGLYVGTRRGVAEVSHSGSTAGYRAFLSRYPDQHLSVAVLCNASSASAPGHARAVADLYLADRLPPPADPAPKYTLTDADLDRLLGVYRHTRTGLPLHLVGAADGLRIERGPALIATSRSRFVSADGGTWEIDGDGRARVTDAFGTVDLYERVTPADETAADLQQLAGAYASADAEATMTVAVDGGSLVLRRRPDTTVRLTPVYADAFSSPLGTVIFRRDDRGRVREFSIVQDRVWDLRFTKEEAR